MSLVCSLSGEAVTEPVVTPSGAVYEKRLLLKHVDAHGTDPVSGEALSVADIIDLKVGAQATRPRVPAVASVPGLLTALQGEWDALMLETFTVRRQLHTAREELSHALYQNDAACRVIARLMRERDDARRQVEELRRSGVTVAAADNASLPGLDNAAHQKINACAQQLSKQRRSREVSPSLASPMDVQAYTQLSSNPVHKTTAPGILAVDLHPVQTDLSVTGGMDASAVIFNRATGKKVATLTGHSKKVGTVAFHPSIAADTVLTGSADSTVRLWRRSGDAFKTAHTYTTHSSEVTQVSLHASGDYVLSASRDRTWAFHDLETGKSLLQVRDPEEAPLTCARLHPDGLILATGTEGNVIRIWDLKSRKNVATFVGHKGHVTSLCFNENGFYMASAARDNALKLWDLRGPKNLTTLSGDAPVLSLDYDHSGRYLAAAIGTEIRVFKDKDFGHVTTLSDHTATVTGVRWGTDARSIASVSMDRNLKFWG